MGFTNSTFKKLNAIVGKNNCTKIKEDTYCYSYDSHNKGVLPCAVVFPKNAEEISQILKIANQENFYVIPRGAGTGMTGGCVPVHSSVIISTARMNKIIEINTNDLISRVEPGVITGDFHRAVQKKGLFYPPDPSSSDISTIGGNVGECAGGPKAVKYGVTKDYVLGLEVVLPTGEIIKTGVKTAKGVVGYDITKLMVGSEGTLGIITEITLKLLPLPEKVKTLSISFDKINNAAETVSEIIRSNIIPRVIEFMDNASIRCVEDYANLGIPTNVEALLIIELDGTELDVNFSMEKLIAICKKRGAKEIKTASTKEETDSLWKARKSISPALLKYGTYKINEDIVVPRSKIPLMVKKIQELQKKSGLHIVSFGHIGDGNIHVNVIVNKDNTEELEKGETIISEIFDYTIELGGTISGEHGIGITKLKYLPKEISEPAIALMKRIKKSFDPNGILNPGKIFE
ncbi:MAG: FAD-binding protein [Desulfobacterales bacterium]|nr:FAD-binding protein [Desulfobacterales bacterium]